jgi:hypothetical protein
VGQEGHLLYSRGYRRVEWVREDTFYGRGIDLYSGSGRTPGVQQRTQTYRVGQTGYLLYSTGLQTCGEREETLFKQFH